MYQMSTVLVVEVATSILQREWTTIDEMVEMIVRHQREEHRTTMMAAVAGIVAAVQMMSQLLQIQ